MSLLGKSTLFLSLLSVTLGSGPVWAQPADHQMIKVAVLPPVVSGKVGVSAKAVLDERLPLGLKSAGAQIVTGEVVSKGLADQKGPCDTECVIKLGNATGCSYVVGATVKADHPFYDLHLWVADTARGKVLATVNQKCEVCPPAALGRKLDLSASQLATRLKELFKAPARLLIASDPAGATIKIDGVDKGKAPLELTVKPGEHEIVAELGGHIKAARKVRAVSGVDEKVALQLLPEGQGGGGARKVLAWSGIGVGVAAIIAGVVLMAMDGGDTNCSAVDPAITPRCEQRDTILLGGVLAGVGVAATATGTYLLLRRHSTSDKTETARNSRWRLGLSGLSVTF